MTAQSSRGRSRVRRSRCREIKFCTQSARRSSSIVCCVDARESEQESEHENKSSARRSREAHVLFEKC